MNRRDFLKAAGLGAAAFFLSGCESSLQKRGDDASRKKPNFVFFLVFFLIDDLGWTDLGCYGSSFYETPNIDKLASEGMRFTDAYAACPVCSPTRASIMTGKYPARIDTTDWFGAPQPETILDEKKCPGWARRMRNFPLLPAPYAAGYETFFAGKWHLGETAEYWPEHQGFDMNKGGHSKGWPPGGYFAPWDNP
ncbi:MAG: sulfatase-like hydrolase/transferase, partial [Planctomycetota bacterium]